MKFEPGDKVSVAGYNQPATFLGELHGFTIVQNDEGRKFAFESPKIFPLLVVGDRVRVVSDVLKANIGHEGTITDIVPERYYGLTVHRDKGGVRHFHYTEVEKIDVGISTGA